MDRKNNVRTTWLLAVLLAAGAAWAQTDTAAEQKPEPAAFSGVVTNSVTGESVTHAHVRLDGNGAPGRAAYGAVTNTDGRFSIRTIAPGRYDLLVERRGYGLLAPSQENGQTIELKPGSEIKDFVVRLVPDAVIAGRVINADGVPAANVYVEAVSRGRPQSTQTDDRGEFRIGGLRAGRYLIQANSSPPPLPAEIRTDGSKAVNYGPTYYPSTVTAKSATPVLARAGQETNGIEIKLVPAPVLYVSGTVSNVPKSVKAAWVDIVAGLWPRKYSVGPDGKFTAWRVPPGRYQVFADYIQGDGLYVRSAPEEITVSNSNIEGINLVCVPPIEVTGQLQVEGGTLVTSQGSTRPSIKLLPLGSIEFAEQDEDVNEDGSFKMTGVLPGRYHVISEDLPQNLYVKSVRVGETESQDGVLDLRNVPSKARLTVRLSMGGAEISGVVRDPKGPAAGVQVALFFDDEYGFDLADSTDAANDGSYAFHGIAPGKYKILAYDPKATGAGWSSTWSSDALALYDSVTERIDVSAGDKVAQDLRTLR
jgi:Carboxypeptidase regulatory-like domain